MSSELEITLDLYDVLVARRVLLDYLQQLYFQFELLVEFLANFEHLHGVLSFMFVIEHFQHLLEPMRTFPKAPEPSTLSISNR